MNCSEQAEKFTIKHVLSRQKDGDFSMKSLKEGPLPIMTNSLFPDDKIGTLVRNFVKRRIFTKLRTVCAQSVVKRCSLSKNGVILAVYFLQKYINFS